MLSEVAKAAAAGIVATLGGDLEALVFPAPQGSDALLAGSAMSVANKIVAIVSGGEERVREGAKAAEEQMRGRLRSLREDAFGRVAKEYFFIDRARAQVDDLFEIFWVAVPIVEDSGGYEGARREAEGLLAARKNTQTWSQPPWARDDIPKSSLDGVRESVFHEDIYDRPLDGPPRPAALSAEERLGRYGVHGAERLCGVGVLKRWGAALDASANRRIERFFSTPHVAAIPLMLGMDNDARRDRRVQEAWLALKDAAKDAVQVLDMVPGGGTSLFGKMDGAILSPGHLAEALEEQGHPRTSDVTRAALEAQKVLFRAAGRGELWPYYGILMADGDGMGAHIDSKKSAEEHRNFSRNLDTFARDAKGVVHEHDGSLLYSGGDDVLALLPLHQALECGRALAKHFHRLTGATLSAGLAVVHCMAPLDTSLGVAQGAEKVAKGLPKKDALAVVVEKRSGGATLVCDHWDTLVPRLLSLSELHDAEAIPDKAGYELAELSRVTQGSSGDGALRAIQVSEARRILHRKRAKRGLEKIAEEHLDKLLGDAAVDAGALGREITVAALFAKAKQQAAPRVEEER